jgi:hypothetical protein
MWAGERICACGGGGGNVDVMVEGGREQEKSGATAVPLN